MRAHVSKLLAYVANKNKTVMEIENKNFDKEERLAAEILGLPYDHFATEEKKFVSGINCTPENANEVMLTLLEDTLRRWVYSVVLLGRSEEEVASTLCA